MEIRNPCPHPITLIGRDGQQVTLSPIGSPARCAVEREGVGELTVDRGLTVPVNQTRFGTVTGLPEPEDGVWYIVALPVAQALPGRRDLYVVDDSVRDAEGRIIGARALAQVPAP